jgi:uncharacterized cysteine cluster protein YcgN (CxxCxxCC family)
LKFWEKPLAELNTQEWEQLCDGCGQCCMHKLEDTDTGELLHTRVACRLFDAASCQCSDYANRLQKVSYCLHIRDLEAEYYHWLPPTCAYRLRMENKPLFAWHPLLSGNRDSVHDAGISMRGRCVSECDVPEDRWVEYAQDGDR